MAVAGWKILVWTSEWPSERKDFNISAPEMRSGGTDDGSVQIYLKHIVEAFKTFLATV